MVEARETMMSLTLYIRKTMLKNNLLQDRDQITIKKQQFNKKTIDSQNNS